MAKPRGDSKLAVAGALTLVLAIAGVLLVKEPLRSSRPVGSGLEMKQSTAEQLVRARLWEDPVAAVDRAIREQGAVKTTSRGSSLAKRLSPLRHAIAQRVHRGEQLTVLLITTTGGGYVESAESRLRDRYAVGTALGAACYAPEDEGHLSFVHWEPGSMASGSIAGVNMLPPKSAVNSGLSASRRSRSMRSAAAALKLTRKGDDEKGVGFSLA